jgi:hypothetical protein
MRRAIIGFLACAAIACGGGGGGDPTTVPGLAKIEIVGGDSCSAYVQLCIDCEFGEYPTATDTTLPTEITKDALPGQWVHAWACNTCDLGGGHEYTIYAHLLWRGQLLKSQAGVGRRVQQTSGLICGPIVEFSTQLPN